MTDTKKVARKHKPAVPFSDKMLDQLLAHCSGGDAESLLGESGLIGQLKKQLPQGTLSADMSHHINTEAASADLGAAAPRPS